MLHVIWLLESSALVGGTWLLTKTSLFRFGEDSENVADLMRRLRREAARCKEPGQLESKQ